MKPPKFSLSIPEMPKFEPRGNIGDRNLTPELKQIADFISVMEQKQDWYGEVALNAFNICAIQARVLVVLCIIMLAIEGPRVVRVALSMVGVKEQPATVNVPPPPSR